MKTWKGINHLEENSKIKKIEQKYQFKTEVNPNKKYEGLMKEGIGFELYSKGADRVASQSDQLKKYAIELAKATRGKVDLKKRVKILKELKKWQDSIRFEINQLEDDIDNLEGY